MRSHFDLDTHDPGAPSVFAELGWVLDEAYAPFRAGGDVLTGSGFVLARMWHTPLRAHTEASCMTDECFSAMLVVEGNGQRSIGQAQVPFEPGVLMIHDARLETEVDVPVSVAAIHLSRAWNAILPSGVRAEDVPLSFRPPARFQAVLAAIVNTAFQERIGESDLGYTAWLASIDAAMSALLNSALDDLRVVRSPATLYERAVALIEQQYSDPEFTVADLAESLSVSKPWLHQAFANEGTTPKRVLQRVRVDHALRLLPPLPTPTEIADAAAASGFATARALRRSLRAGEPDTPATTAG
ncbi:hypothetical protein MICRO8M_50157 [Microbacterium sp. 8M]|nr:hypothetical protein MICRO8M_50157 [Microbacterium sp. 8M]